MTPIAAPHSKTRWEEGMFSFFFLFFGCSAYGIFVRRPGIEPVPLASEMESFTYWTTREVPAVFSFDIQRVLEDTPFVEGGLDLCCVAQGQRLKITGERI